MEPCENSTEIDVLRFDLAHLIFSSPHENYGMLCYLIEKKLNKPT